MRYAALFWTSSIVLLASLPTCAESRVVTRAELRTEGVAIRKIRHATPMASLALETAVVRSDMLGLYQISECIILKEEVDIDSLSDIDAAVRSGAPVARHVQSNKDRSVFFVLGKEVTKAYLAFTFTAAPGAASNEPRRFLMPVAAAAPKESSPETEVEKQAPLFTGDQMN